MQDKMRGLLNQRQRYIIEKVKEEGTVRVSALSNSFEVSEETIRRDLEKLENEGFVHRVHGGAIGKRQDGIEVPLLKRKEKHYKEKIALAKEASKCIDDGDIIGIDASTTCALLAKEIKDQNLTVITNSIVVALELANAPAVSVIVVGGHLRQDSLSLVGFTTENTIEKYHIDKFFFSCSGFDIKRGVSDQHEQQAQTKSKMMSISEKNYLLADSSKFEVKSLVQVCDFDSIDCLYTDNNMEISKIRKLNEVGIVTEIAKVEE